jgi:hypothetical protein
MKKLRLKALSLGAREILDREQLKRIVGGCSSDADCTAGYCNTATGDCVSGGDGSDNGSVSGCDTFTPPCGICGCQSPQACAELGAACA